MVNDVCLSKHALRERKRVLLDGRVFKAIPGRLELADMWEGSSGADIEARLKDIVEIK